MEPRDRPFDVVDGAECAACGMAVPADDVRILAQRDDLAFAELPCPHCGSVSLAILVGPPGDQLPSETPGSARATDPIGPDDVLDMHLLLAGWDGDLRSLVGRDGGSTGAR